MTNDAWGGCYYKMMHHEAFCKCSAWGILSVFLFELHNLFFKDVFYFSISEVSTFTKVPSAVNELFITFFKRLVFPLLLSSVTLIKTWLDAVLDGPAPVWKSISSVDDSHTHFHIGTAISLQSIFLQQRNKWRPCCHVVTGKGCFVRINHSGNSDELRSCASLCRKLFHLRQRISFCCGKAKKCCLPMLRLGFRSSAKNKTKTPTFLHTFVCTALCQCAPCGALGCMFWLKSWKLECSIRFLCSKFDRADVWGNKWNEGFKVKFSFLASSLQDWHFSCLSFCFCVLWFWENPRLGFNWCHCHIASSQRREPWHGSNASVMSTGSCFALACAFILQCAPPVSPVFSIVTPRSFPHLLFPGLRAMSHLACATHLLSVSTCSAPPPLMNVLASFLRSHYVRHAERSWVGGAECFL